MSRFEPNAEPSMEEILASIRRIIAEDTSGSRSVPPIPSASSRSNAAPTPASQLQRGFMSREAFLRSSQSPEETNQRYFTPVTPQDPDPAVETVAKPAAEKAEKTSAPSQRPKEEAPAEATPKPVAAEPSKPVETKPIETKPIEAKPIVAKPAEAAVVDVVEEVEVQAVADDMGPKLLAPPEAKSEAAIIDAQLVELLGEDLKALREAESSKIENESAIAADAKPAAPVEKPSQKPLQTPLRSEPQQDVTRAPAASVGQMSDPIDNSDPFAFDLGPSPFLSRSPADHPVERQIRSEPLPSPATAPDRPINGSANGSAIPAERGWQKFNGTAGSSAFARPSAPISTHQEPAPRSSAPFAVPSVSATLGPHRRLEPLSNAFQSAPADRHSPAGFPHAETGHPSDYLRSASPAANAHHDQLETVLHPSPTADAAASGDRKMEDAVADLLRPLLKTWLAENMPKIVERALRREMTERLLPGQKNPRD